MIKDKSGEGLIRRNYKIKKQAEACFIDLNFMRLQTAYNL